MVTTKKKSSMNVWNFLKAYNIDKKFVYGKNLFSLYIKNKKWKNENYICIFAIPYVESFNTLMNIQKVMKELKNCMKVVK